MHKHSIHSNNHAYLQHNSSSQYSNQHDFVFVVVHACTWLHMINQSDMTMKLLKHYLIQKRMLVVFFWKLLFITTQNVFHYRMNEVMNKRSKPMNFYIKYIKHVVVTFYVLKTKISSKPWYLKILAIMLRCIQGLHHPFAMF